MAWGRNEDGRSHAEEGDRQEKGVLLVEARDAVPARELAEVDDQHVERRGGEERQPGASCPTTAGGVLSCGQACTVVLKGTSGVLFVQACH